MRTVEADILVIGSGPGGAMTAAILAEAGLDVLIVEEGPDLSVESTPSYSMAEMDQKWRAGGLTTTMGKTNVTYIEGRCVGGASEINAALYHPPHDETLDGWARDFDIREFSAEGLAPEFDWLEAQVGVNPRQEGEAPNSKLLEAGARALGWRTTEIKRFWTYPGGRRSMSRTLIPRAVAAGARLRAETRVLKLHTRGRRALYATARDAAGPLRIDFERVIVCCGAVQTPSLLRRSGIKKKVGDSLRLHPMVRIAARWDNPINDPSFGVPVRQVEEFKPALTLGCSHSSQAHIALWLDPDHPHKRQVMADWRNVAVFYAAVCGEGRGSVRSLPMLNEPLVRYELTDNDRRLMEQGVQRLEQLVRAAGAQEVYKPAELAVTTIHLFSSCPMGEHSDCPVDSYGRLKALDNVMVNDASLLPTSPGVNPQATIMAIARRNARHWAG